MVVDVIGGLAIAFLVPVALALAAHPLLDRRATWIVCMLLMAPVPLAAPAEWPLVRFLAAVNVLEFAAKMLDQFVDRKQRLPFRAYVAWLANPLSLVERRLSGEPTPSRKQNLIAVAGGLLEAAIGLGLFLLARDAKLQPFLLEHVALVLPFFLIVEGGTRVMTAAVRLGGFRARDVLDRPFVVATPAEFWRRYNRIVGQALYENCFLKVGGRRRPVVGTIIVFLVSAAIHEYVFGVTLGRVQGFQTAFFVIQGLAVAATVRVRPQGARKIAWTAATISFNLMTSLLFFASWDQMLPFWP